MPETPDEANRVVAFWRESGPTQWFAKEPAFDRSFRETFLDVHEQAARGSLDHWLETPDGALALVLLLDQFPRNAFRGTPRMYDTDAVARRCAQRAIDAGHDQTLEPNFRVFFYMPFAHSERVVDQERSVELNGALGEPSLSRSQHHRDIIRRFGRFPHRNPILGRTMTAEEQRYLDEGGYTG